jgi:hypothetical protein
MRQNSRMSTTQNKPTQKKRTRQVVGRLLEAVDKALVATEEVKRARAALAREAKRLQTGEGAKQ